MPNITCSYCGEKNHNIRTCKRYKKETGSCFDCGKRFHVDKLRITTREDCKVHVCKNCAKTIKS